ALGACPSVLYQQPGGGYNRLKTLETGASYIKAALLLYQITRSARYLAVTRQRDGTSGSPRPRDHLAGLREHHGVAGAGSSTGGAAGRWRRR
ncbi:MAG TPA: hypothetical protein VMV07_21610, partial [Streptosporangiaceae bacterium]|nr:hypothetical protein [Streptosporangiaceae bacterium]